MSHSRRDFLVRTTCAALSASAIQGTIRQFGLANLLATPNAVTGGYRALVCVLLNGGSDSNNRIVPTDSTNYGFYSAARPGLATTRCGEHIGRDQRFHQRLDIGHLSGLVYSRFAA